MFSTTDVYTAASSIGQELQLLIDEHGHEIFQSLMFKVISILEYLEQYVNFSAEMDVRISDLHTKHDSLKLERQSFAEFSDGYDKNLEQLQQSWYRETKSLFEEATLLEKENRRLILKCDVLEPTEKRENDSYQVSQASKFIRSASLNARPKFVNINAEESTSNSSQLDDIVGMAEKRLAFPSDKCCSTDLQLNRLLKVAIAEQNIEKRKIRRLLLQTEASLDAAEEEVYRLARQSGTLLSFRSPTRREARQLREDKVEAEKRLRICEQKIENISSSVENSKPPIETTPSIDLIKNNELSALSIITQMPLHISPGQGVESVETALRPQCLVDNQIIMQELIYERNALRCRIVELEASLQQLKDDSDETVFGPLPLEPSEKLRPSFQPEKSGIKGLFSFLHPHNQ